MTSARKFSLLKFSSLLVVIGFSTSVFAQAKAAAGDKRLYGEADLLTNYVDKGVTQSDKSYALQAGFGYKMGPNSRLGFWGSSVKYPSNEETVNLRPYFDVKMDFTPNTGLTFRYDFSRYFQSSLRNTSLLTLDFESFSYHVIAEMTSNWEGTGTGATWFAFQKQFNLPAQFIFVPSIGYSQVSASGYTNYFDLRLPVQYRFADILYEFAMTYNSNASQFNGRGDMAFLLALKVNF